MLRLFVLLICFSLFVGCERQERLEIKKEKVNQVELAYYTRGKGEPLVLIMGFRGTMAFWDPALIEILEKKFKLIIFDNRGTGLSTDTLEDKTTISQMAEDTAGLVKALGYQKAHILGWSMGSRIAMELAIKHPEVVDSLILCSPNPGGKYGIAHPSDAYDKLTAPHITRQEGLSLIFPDTPVGREAADALVGRLFKAIALRTIPDNFEVSTQTIQRQVNALKLWEKDENIFDSLATIKRPTLVAGGLSDALDSPQNVRIVANQIPFAWTAYFAGAGHDFLSQDYEYFGKLVTLFIESNKGR